MNFSTFIDRLAKVTVLEKTDSKVKELLKQCANFGKQEVSKYALWNELIVPNNELILIPDYKTGTVNITNNSRTVTLNTGIVSNDFKGRFLFVKSSRYEIISVNTALNTITLKSPVIDDSESNISYRISKRYYRLPTDARVILPNTDYYDNRSVFQRDGYDFYASDYSTGNVTVSKNSDIVTGDGSQSFLDNVYPGDIITIQSFTGRVLKVNSDNEIKMVNKFVDSFSGSYRIYSDTPYKASITSSYSNTSNTIFNNVVVNDDKKSIINYSYVRHLYDMINDDDTTEMPPIFDLCMLDFAKSEYMRSRGTAGWQNELMLAQKRLEKLSYEKELVFEAGESFDIAIPRGFGRGTR